MKILFNCNLPFALAHGGHQIQIERNPRRLWSRLRIDKKSTALVG